MKLVADVQPRQYELTYLLPASYTEAELASFNESIAELVTKYKGSVDSQENWGKKDMAYTIKKGGKRHSEAHYVHLVMTLPATKINEFERDVYLNEKIVRHLLVVAEEVKKSAPKSEGVKTA